LHSNSANQTIDRIINFFSEERRKQLLTDLSSNLRAIISQRLVRTVDGKGRKAAIEILINTHIVADKLRKGEFHELKSIMSKSRELGMKTFDWSLFELYNEGSISYEEAIRNADSANELRLNIKLNGTRQPNEPEPAASAAAEPVAAAGAAAAREATASAELSLEPDVLEDESAA
jgi:twitching motility protein PilU